MMAADSTPEPGQPTVTRGRLRKWLRRLGILMGILAIGVGALVVDGWRAMGQRPSGERLSRIETSDNYQDGRFVNTLPARDPELVSVIRRFYNGSEVSAPDEPLPIHHRTSDELAALPDSGLRITWLGHSTSLVEIDEHRILFDPVWGDRTSPFTLLGPKRFHEPPLPLEGLPPIDAVVISHDHYDHLDHPTIVALAKRPKIAFIVPLGVGSHLEYWGVDPSRIIELDWWGEAQLGALRVVATPARHFSGRSIVMADRDATLWAGWALVGPQHRVFFSGDTAMFPGFAEIGQRLGPFDITMMECGAYDPNWADVHMGPEQAVQAHRLLRGELMMPVHWGTFDLAAHGWTEPVERLRVAAREAGVPIVVPRQGDSIEPASAPALAQWWPELPWESAMDRPVVSSGDLRPSVVASAP